jgi:hypothetical protein
MIDQAENIHQSLTYYKDAGVITPASFHHQGTRSNNSWSYQYNPTHALCDRKNGMRKKQLC